MIPSRRRLLHTADTCDPLNLSAPSKTARYASRRPVREDAQGCCFVLEFVCSRPHPKNKPQEPLKMDPSLKEENLQSAEEEEEEVDPRIQVRIYFFLE